MRNTRANGQWKLMRMGYLVFLIIIAQLIILLQFGRMIGYNMQCGNVRCSYLAEILSFI